MVVVVLLMNTTTLADILPRLAIIRRAGRVGVSVAIVDTLFTSCRGTRNAYAARGDQPVRRGSDRPDNDIRYGSGRAELWRVLFGKSYGRAENVHQAMLARGFHGTFIALRPHSLEWRDVAMAAAAIAMSVGAAWR